MYTNVKWDSSFLRRYIFGITCSCRKKFTVKWQQHNLLKANARHAEFPFPSRSSVCPDVSALPKYSTHSLDKHENDVLSLTEAEEGSKCRKIYDEYVHYQNNLHVPGKGRSVGSGTGWVMTKECDMYSICRWHSHLHSHCWVAWIN